MGDNNNSVNLPPGFRFNPTDQELILHLLHRKAALLPCVPNVIPDLKLYPYDPWDLTGKALAGDNYQWYFFSRRTSNRVSASGYWMALDVDDEPIVIPHDHDHTASSTRSTSSSSKVAGLKKYLVFYMAQGIKTNWIMHEYRLMADSCASSSSNSSSSSSRSSSSSYQRRSSASLLNPKIDWSKWVLCRVFEQNGGGSEGSFDHGDEDDDDGTELSGLDEVFLSLDDLDDISLP
ncbi:NAC domain [Macleaya cordata]|uniref:NAC domain n=1 Tax=Macleaya cordata TaxID=56857 RepID=A0A200PZK4_MACCD|nr:NAC domain [Macleaya cordata]